MVVVAICTCRQLDDGVRPHHSSVGIAQVRIVVAVRLVDQNAEPHLRVAFGQHVGQQVRLRGIHAHLVDGERVDVAVDVAVGAVLEDVLAATVGGCRCHQHVVRRVPFAVRPNTVELHGEVGQRCLVGILDAVAVGVQPDAVADLQRRRFTDDLHVAQTGTLRESTITKHRRCHIAAHASVARQAAHVGSALREERLVRVHHADRNLARAFHDGNTTGLRVVVSGVRVDPPVELATVETLAIPFYQRTTVKPLGHVVVVHLAEAQRIAARRELAGDRVSLVGGALVGRAVDDLHHYGAVVVEVDVGQDRLLVGTDIERHGQPRLEVTVATVGFSVECNDGVGAQIWLLVVQREADERRREPCGGPDVIAIDGCRQVLAIQRDGRITDHAGVDVLLARVEVLAHGNAPRPPLTAGHRGRHTHRRLIQRTLRHRDRRLGQDVGDRHRVGAGDGRLACHIDGNQLLVVEIGHPQRVPRHVQVNVAHACPAHPVGNHQRVVMVRRAHCVARDIGGAHINPQRCQVDELFRCIRAL